MVYFRNLGPFDDGMGGEMWPLDDAMINWDP